MEHAEPAPFPLAYDPAPYRNRPVHGDSGAPGRGDPAPVVRSGHHSHYAGPDGNFLLDNSGRPPVAATRARDPSHAAWYAKPAPTFIDAIASVRRHLWLASEGFSMSAAEPDIQECRPICTADLSIRWPTQLECTKPSLGLTSSASQFSQGFDGCPHNQPMP